LQNEKLDEIELNKQKFLNKNFKTPYNKLLINLDRSVPIEDLYKPREMPEFDCRTTHLNSMSLFEFTV
jgi:hypothetical protein